MAFGLIHPAIMVRAHPDFQVVHTGPPSSAAGAIAPAWSQAIVSIDGLPNPVAFYSIHMPARSAVGQLMQAEWLATFLAQRGEIDIHFDRADIGGGIETAMDGGDSGDAGLGLAQHVARFRPADLTHNDAVRTIAQAFKDMSL